MEFQTLLSILFLIIFIIGLALFTYGFSKFIEMIKNKTKEKEVENQYKPITFAGIITTLTSSIVLSYLIYPTIQPLYLITLIIAAIAIVVFVFKIYMPFLENWMTRKMKEKKRATEESGN